MDVCVYGCGGIGCVCVLWCMHVHSVMYKCISGRICVWCGVSMCVDVGTWVVYACVCIV